MALLTASNITLELDCYPKVSSNIQQAWDAADLYLLESAKLGKHPAIINDQWGVLTCFSQQQDNTLVKSLYCWSDSYCSQQGIKNNLAKLPNAVNTSELIIDQGYPAFPDNTDSIWIQCPKSFDQLHWWLQLAQQQLGSGIKVYIAGMAKHIPVKWLNWLENHNSDYQQFPIKKKARLMSFNLGESLPALNVLKSYQDLDKQDISALPGVFSRDHMDIGSRFFIHQLSQLNLKGTVIDLGCGNGLLSIASLHYAQTNALELILCDDSSLALASAKLNLDARDYPQAQYIHTDALLNVSDLADTILCNPPFHSGNRISTAAAERMFKQARKQLKKGGQLLVIANRHLPYAPLLKKNFNKIKTLASDSKFVVYQCLDAK
ncbi:MAG: class I SAM-dependent methyltransferase [Oleispira sp.]|nr:class I SAM-dependent methyltransferase [Oleispira sp.]